MIFDAQTTLRTLLESTLNRCPRAAAMRFRHEGVWMTRTYRDLGIRVRQVAETAGSLGLQPGRDNAALMLDNRPEWVDVYLGLAGAGITVVPIDPKLRPPEIAHILADSESVVVVAAERQRALLETALPSAPNVRHVVLIEAGTNAGTCAGRPCLDYETLLASAAPAAAGPDAWFARHRPLPASVASIVYTSGTTGRPKGAMLTHANFCADVAGCLQVIPSLDRTDRFLVVLPLFHSFSFTTNLVVPLSRGACMAFVESLRTVAEDLKTLRPTILMAVPLLVEKIHGRIMSRLRADRLPRVLLASGLDWLVALRVHRSLGGRLRLVLVGGAPCPVQVIRDLRRLGVPVIEGYGLTEASPVVSLSGSRDARPGTVGRKLSNIDVRIADPDSAGVGELRVRGPIVMSGYFKNPAATAETMDGDWLRTGDLASMDADGYLTIRGRRKALIVNREGKNIYPEEVEQCIGANPHVQDVVVLAFRGGGETGERVGVIVVPRLDAIREASGTQEPPWTEVEGLMRQAIQQQCRSLADYKHPRKILVRREPLERTSTQKVRRCAYAGVLDEP